MNLQDLVRALKDAKQLIQQAHLWKIASDEQWHESAEELLPRLDALLAQPEEPGGVLREALENEAVWHESVAEGWDNATAFDGRALGREHRQRARNIRAALAREGEKK